MKYICKDLVKVGGKVIASPYDIVVIGEDQIYNVTTGVDIKEISVDEFKTHLNNIHDDYITVDTVPSKEDNFRNIIEELYSTYIKKNSDYGNSFDRSLDEWGLQAAAFRMDDKMNRFKNLVRTGSFKVKDESVVDTLKDLANYAIMTAMYIEYGNV